MQTQGKRSGATMHKVTAISLAILAGVVLAANVLAQSSPRDECVTLCKGAAAFIKEKGVDAAIAEINNKDGKFVSKNTYVFLMDLKGNLLAHPMNPQFVGKNLSESKDTTGKLFVREYLEVARTKSDGWTEYMYPKPEELKKTTPFKEKISSKKLSYVYRVPGKDLLVVAGVFE